MALCIFSFQFVYFVPNEVPRSLVHVFFPINAYNLLFLFVQIFRAFGSIDIIVEPKMITLEWIASPCNDMFADAVLSAVLQVKTFLMVIKIFVSILRMLLRILIFENYICSFFLQNSPSCIRSRNLVINSPLLSKHELCMANFLRMLCFFLFLY